MLGFESSSEQIPDVQDQCRTDSDLVRTGFKKMKEITDETKQFLNLRND